MINTEIELRNEIRDILIKLGYTFKKNEVDVCFREYNIARVTRDVSHNPTKVEFYLDFVDFDNPGTFLTSVDYETYHSSKYGEDYIQGNY